MAAYPTGNDDGDRIFKPSDRKSPVTYESFSSVVSNLVMAYCRNTTRNNFYEADLYYNKNTGEVYGNISQSSGRADAKAYITVTKIEAYY